MEEPLQLDKIKVGLKKYNCNTNIYMIKQFIPCKRCDPSYDLIYGFMYSTC